jgi:hypothetical protein
MVSESSSYCPVDLLLFCGAKAGGFTYEGQKLEFSLAAENVINFWKMANGSALSTV